MNCLSCCGLSSNNSTILTRRYAENSSSCCSELGSRESVVWWQKVRSCFWPDLYVWDVDFALPAPR